FVDVAVIGFVVLTLDRVHRHFPAVAERRRGVVLRGQRVRSAQSHLRAARDQRQRQVRRLRRDVQARPDPHSLERLLLLEPLLDEGQDTHLLLRPLDARPTLLRERKVLHVTVHRASSSPDGAPPTDSPFSPVSARWSVRPRSSATGPRTASAGPPPTGSPERGPFRGLPAFRPRSSGRTPRGRASPAPRRRRLP